MEYITLFTSLQKWPYLRVVNLMISLLSSLYCDSSLTGSLALSPRVKGGNDSHSLYASQSIFLVTMVQLTFTVSSTLLNAAMGCLLIYILQMQNVCVYYYSLTVCEFTCN